MTTTVGGARPARKRRKTKTHRKFKPGYKRLQAQGGQGARSSQGSFLSKLTSIEIGSKKVKRAELISFSRELATLIEAGIGIDSALNLLHDQRAGTAFEAVIRQLKDDLNSGKTIAESMSSQPNVFPQVYVRTVSSADRGAPLTTTLGQAADFLDSAQSAIAQAKRSLIYPVMVVFVGIGIVTMLLTVSLPQMIGLFETMDASLPMPTKVLIALSEFIRTYPLYILGTLVVTVVGGMKLVKTDRGTLFLHQMLLKVPMLGRIIIGGDIARSTGALASLSEVGLPLPEAMDVAQETAGNLVVRAALLEAREGLIAGNGLARPLEKTGLFPPTFVQTLKVAEDTGTLDENLRRMSDFYQQDSSERVKGMVGLIEPLATITVALAVGFVAMAVVMPMYSILGSLDQ
ncbi:MAG: type II secretion system F family protein [Dehalococcoidia bacterium]|nr:type II secretion system F family protein [Dehalococcoidia bacterium]